MTIVAVARDKYARGLPHPTKAAQFAYEQVELVDALLRTYESDAHMVSYVVNYQEPPEDYRPGWQQRLKKDTDLSAFKLEANMTCFTVDVDNEKHAEWKPELLALATEQASLPILQTTAIFYTKHGRRIIQPLTKPIPVQQAERYLRKYLLELQIAGVGVDMACKDWTRHMRMPNVRREGDANKYTSPLISVDHLAERVPTEPDPEDPPDARRKTSKRASVAVPKTYETEAPPVFEKAVASIAVAISTSVTENWHSMYLAVSGALLKSGYVMAEALPAIVFAIAVRAGSVKPENHRRSAEDTVARHSSGMAVTGVRELKMSWPKVADAVIDATDERLAKAKEEAAAPPKVAQQTLAEITAALTNVIRNAPDGVTVVAGSCGLGKGYATRAVAEERARKLYLTEKATGARAPAGSKTSISADKTDLVIQTANYLRSKGIAVRRLFGVLSEQSIDDPKAKECKYYDTAVHLARGGQSIPYEFCTGRGKQKCKYFDTCTAKDGVDGPADARVTVGPHALLGELDRAAGPTGLLIIDEPPPSLETILITQEDVGIAIGNLYAMFETKFAAEMMPVLHAISKWKDCEMSFEDITQEISPITELKRNSPPARLNIVQQAMYNTEVARKLGVSSRVLKGMYRAMCSPKLVGVRLDDRGIVVTSTNEILTNALQREGSTIITDANAKSNLDGYAKIVGYKPHFHQFEIEDSVHVERTFLRCGSANRAGWFSHGHLQVSAGVIGALRAVLDWIEQGKSKSTLIVTFKDVELAIKAAFGLPVDQEWKDAGHPASGLAALRRQLGPILETFQLSAPLPKERLQNQAQAHAKSDVQEVVIVRQKTGPLRRIWLAHYRAVRGLDDFMGCDSVATVGDPWQNIGDTDAEAEFLAVDANVHAEARCHEELEQAHGRLRTIHRTASARALHVGRVVPGGVGWRGAGIVVSRLEGGRPANARSMGLDELRGHVEALGGVRATARAMGCAHGSVSKYLSGNRGVPPAVASHLRDLAKGVSEPQGGGATGSIIPDQVLWSGNLEPHESAFATDTHTRTRHTEIASALLGEAAHTKFSNDAS
jgi:hypothetical protein